MMRLSSVAPRTEQKRSQMNSPRPSSWGAPSTCYADMAAPQTKPRGNSCGPMGRGEMLDASTLSLINIPFVRGPQV